MDRKEILEKATQKAIDGGWSCVYLPSKLQRFEWNEDSKGWFDWEDRVLATDFIFSHDFAKALWDDNSLPDVSFHIGENLVTRPSNWKWHLQQMVIADDPIRYLGENI